MKFRYLFAIFLLTLFGSATLALAQEGIPDFDTDTGDLGEVGAASNLERPYAPGYVLVQLAAGSSSPDLQAQARGYEHIFGDWYKAPIDASLSPVEAMAEISSQDAVRTVELDYIIQLSPQELSLATESLAAPDLRPNDPNYRLQWHFPPVQAEQAWDVNGGQGVVVAVIDSGVAKGSDLACQTFVNEFNAITNQSGAGVAADDMGHGTHVAGTIAQCTNNGLGVAGLAYRSTIMPVKVLNSRGSGTSSDIAQGIDWARTHGADVINLSLGFSCGNQAWPSCSSSIMNSALAAAAAADIVIVAAAGNDNEAVVGFPGNHPDTIAVGAVDFNLNRSPYSSYGSALDIVAPGGDTTVDRNNDGYVDGVLQQTFSSGSWGYYFYQGTSMATPHVVGAATMLRAHAPSASRTAIKNALLNTARDLGDPGRDDRYGRGLLQIRSALDNLSGLSGDFTQPAANAVVVAPITLRVEGTGIARVVFTTNGTGSWTFIGEDTSPPFEVTWDMAGVPAGRSFLIGAELYDSSGNRLNRVRTITRSQNDSPPQFITPAANANVQAPLKLAVTGSNLDRVLFTSNGTGQWRGIALDTQPPFETTWDLAGVPVGSRFLIGAQTYSASGQRRDVTIWVTRQADSLSGDFTQPAANAVVSPPTRLRVEGTAIARVVFTTNGTGPWTLIGQDTTAPFEVTWDMAGVPDGRTFLIGAELYDAAGNRLNRARWITKRSDSVPPSGNFTAPVANATVNSPLRIQVQAQDNSGGSGIDRVVFTSDGTGQWRVLGEDRSAPYEVTWDLAGVAFGRQFMLGAEIYDKAGNQRNIVRWVTRSAGAGLVNGDFERGRGVGWAESSSNGWNLIYPASSLPGLTPHGGNWAAWLGGDENEIAYLHQQVAIPASSATLRFWYWGASADYCGYDFGGVIVNSTTVVDSFNLCDAEDTNGWVRRTVDLAAYAGQMVNLQIRIETDGSLNSNLYIDDVTLGATTLGDLDVRELPQAPDGQWELGKTERADSDPRGERASQAERFWQPLAEKVGDEVEPGD